MSDKPANPANAKNAKDLENGKKPTNPENLTDTDGLDSATILETFDAATILATYPLVHGPREGETIRNRNIPKHRTRARPARRRDHRHAARRKHGGVDMGPSGAGNARAPHPHPDFPGYGRRTNEAWPGIAGAAADIAELIRTHAIGGKAHVVGLSLGGFVSVELLRHYPQLVRSCAISGSAVSGYARWERALICPKPCLSLRTRWQSGARPGIILFMVRKNKHGAWASKETKTIEEQKKGVQRSFIARMGGISAVLAFIFNILIVPALIIALPIVAMWPSHGGHHPTVEVRDEAGVLQADSLIKEIQKLTFRKKVHVAVLTVSGTYIDNLNDEVLKYARDHSDTDVPWISPSVPDYWNNGLVILAVAPDGRKVGCYFGEDVKVPLESQADIQNAAKEQYRNADWQGGTVSMAKEAADVIGGASSGNRSLSQVVRGIFVVLGVAWLCYGLWRGYAARRRAREALGHYSQVTHDYATTEHYASAIPEDEPHGAQVMERYRWFRNEYEKTARDWKALEGVCGAKWFAMKTLRQAKSLKEQSAALDSLDNVIANTATFLSMSSGWEQVWANEQGPVLEDLGSLDALCAKIDHADVALTTEETKGWVRTQHQKLSKISYELETGQTKPSAALDELDRIAEQTKVRATRLARQAIDADTSSYAAQRRQRFNDSLSSTRRAGYSGSWFYGGRRGSYRPHSTIRLNPSSPALFAVDSSEGSFGGSGSSSSFDSISDLVVGYSSASSYVPASSGSSSSSGSSFSSGGFSSSSFSGAGSSSSF